MDTSSPDCEVNRNSDSGKYPADPETTDTCISVPIVFENVKELEDNMVVLEMSLEQHDSSDTHDRQLLLVGNESSDDAAVKLYITCFPYKRRC
ncbi:hypothetical protein Aduo_013779 [Ancylostoma duodenale]